MENNYWLAFGGYLTAVILCWTAFATLITGKFKSPSPGAVQRPKDPVVFWFTMLFLACSTIWTAVFIYGVVTGHFPMP